MESLAARAELERPAETRGFIAQFRGFLLRIGQRVIQFYASAASLVAIGGPGQAGEFRIFVVVEQFSHKITHWGARWRDGRDGLDFRYLAFFVGTLGRGKTCTGQNSDARAWYGHTGSRSEAFSWEQLYSSSSQCLFQDIGSGFAFFAFGISGSLPFR